MCLHNILGKPEKTSGIGYKVYRVNEKNEICTIHFNMQGERSWYISEKLELGARYISRKNIEYTNKDKSYKTGFHIFASKQGARKWREAGSGRVIVKVKYSKARLTGVQTCRLSSLKCIIADEITLLEIVH